MGEVFLAFDRTTQQPVALKIVREESRMPGDDEALRQELLLARSVSHPNVCRVHDLAPCPYGPILVMEHITGQTLHTHIRREEGPGRVHLRRVPPHRRPRSARASPPSTRRASCTATSSPATSWSPRAAAIVLDFGFAQERARLSARRPGAPPDGGTPNYMAPERLRSGGASADDDLYALASRSGRCGPAASPSPGYKPRAKPMRQQIMFDVPSGSVVDEIKQIFRGLTDDPSMRPPARHLRFFNPMQLTTNPMQVPRERLDPGPPPGRAQTQTFTPGAQSLLVTFATNAPEFVGELIPLDQAARSRSVAAAIRHRRARGDGQRPPRDARVAVGLVADRGPRQHQRHLRGAHLRAQAGHADARRRGAARRAARSSS